jgi:hypothetical protein
MLATSLALPAVSRADLFFDPVSVVVGLIEALVIAVASFLLTLLIEVPIVALPLRRHVASPRKLVLLLIAINACTYTSFAFVQSLVPGYMVFVLGEVSVAIIEAILVWQVVKRVGAGQDPPLLAAPGSPAPSRSFVMGLVVAANVASAIVGVVLGLMT